MGNNSSNLKEVKQKKHQKGGVSEYLEDIHKTDNDFDISSNGVKLKEHKKGAFISFYAPWCGYCKMLAPSWNNYAKKMNTSSVQFFAVDCTNNNCNNVSNSLDIQSYPTIKYVDESGNVVTPVYQNGEPFDRSPEGIRRFLKEKKLM
jgi:protein disulfide-isomerase A6